MKTEHQKMLAGELYDPTDADLVAARAHARDLCLALNVTREAEEQERRKILNELFGAGGDTVWMQPPFFCDYGSNIELGERVFFNFNCVVLDVCPVIVGSFTFLWPCGADLHAHAPAKRRNASARGVWQTGIDWIGRLGRRRGDHSPRRADRFAGGDRCWERGHKGHTGGRICRRQPMSRYSRNHKMKTSIVDPCWVNLLIGW